MRKSILIADDERTITCLIHQVLAERGHEVTIVHTGREAFALLTSCRDLYSLAIIDVHMTEWDGLESLEMIRGLGVTIPIIIMSGDERLNIPAGVPFLAKPFNIKEFISMVDKQLTEDTQ